jgi:glycosyltransferase involved in cell wall biosynthesis
MTGSTARCRVAVVTGLPAPYREPVFAELSRRPGIELRVFYAAKGHADVGWVGESVRREYDHRFLRNYMPERGRRLPLVGYLTLGLPGELRRFQPDYLIIYGYNQLSQCLAFAFALRHQVPFALRSDSNALLDTRTDWKSRSRRQCVRAIVRRAHAVLPVGSLNRRFWEGLGATPTQVFPAPYAVANEQIARIASGIWRDPLAPTRLLYVGRLLPRKGVDLLMHAFNQIVPTTDATLTMVGDGPLRGELQAMQSEQARSRTRWLGKVPNRTAVEEMGRADLFVLPSRYEPWGLVINEAMAAGLPVIAHRHVGAAVDLIVPNETGWTFDELHSNSLAETLHRALVDRSRLREMGQLAQERIQHWSIAGTVDGMLAAIRNALPGFDPAIPVEPRREVTYA